MCCPASPCDPQWHWLIPPKTSQFTSRLTGLNAFFHTIVSVKAWMVQWVINCYFKVEMQAVVVLWWEDPCRFDDQILTFLHPYCADNSHRKMLKSWNGMEMENWIKTENSGNKGGDIVSWDFIRPCSKGKNPWGSPFLSTGLKAREFFLQTLEYRSESCYIMRSFHPVWMYVVSMLMEHFSSYDSEKEGKCFPEITSCGRKEIRFLIAQWHTNTAQSEMLWVVVCCACVNVHWSLQNTNLITDHQADTSLKSNQQITE